MVPLETKVWSAGSRPTSVRSEAVAVLKEVAQLIARGAECVEALRFGALDRRGVGKAPVQARKASSRLFIHP